MLQAAHCNDEIHPVSHYSIDDVCLSKQMDGDQHAVFAHSQHKLTVLATDPANNGRILPGLHLSVFLLLLLLRIRWWACWTRAACHISLRATTPSPLWRAALSPPPAWPPAAASAWITSRAWRVWPAFPPCRPCPPCPAPSPTAPPPTAHRATPSTTWRPTSTASTDKVRSIDFDFFSSTSAPRQIFKKAVHNVFLIDWFIVSGFGDRVTIKTTKPQECLFNLWPSAIWKPLAQTAALFYGLLLKRIKMKTSEPNQQTQFMIIGLF